MPRVTGKGSIVPLDKNVPAKKCRRWRIYIPTGKDPVTNKYKKITRVFHGTKTEAQRELERLIAEINSGIDIDAGNITFKEFAEQYYEERCALGKIRETSKNNSMYSLNAICDLLGNERIADITPNTVSNLYVKLSKKYKASSAKQYANIFATIMKCAFNRRMISFNPCVSVNKPKAGESSREALTKEQTKRLLDELSSGEMNELKILFSNMLFCGLRVGEAMALQWRDIDFNSCYLYVNKTIYQNEIHEPKTKNSKRALPMPQSLIEMLQAWKKQSFLTLLKNCVVETLEDMSEIFVSCNKAGEPIKKCRIITYTEKLRKLIGAEQFTPHILRHTYCTLLCANGVDIITAIHLLGHTDGKMIETIYGHMVVDNAVLASKKINDALSF